MFVVFCKPYPNQIQEPFKEQNIHLCLGRLGRDGDHHVEGEVGHGDPGSVLGHTLERPVIIEVGPEQDELALERPVSHVGVGEVILPHIWGTSVQVSPRGIMEEVASFSSDIGK